MSYITYKTGFSLLEAVIYSAIFSILIVTSIQLLQLVLTNSSQNYSNLIIEDTGNFVLQKISLQLKKSYPMTPPVLPPQLSLDHLSIENLSKEFNVSFMIRNHFFESHFLVR